METTPTMTNGTISTTEQSEKPKYKKTSTTLLLDYLRCGKYCEFKNVHKLQGEDGDPTSRLFGKMMHKIYEDFFPNINIKMAELDCKKHFTMVLKILGTKHWDFNLPESKKEDRDKLCKLFCEERVASWKSLSEKGKIDLFFPLVTE